MIPAPLRPYFGLVSGVLAVSTAAIFIRLAQEADASSLTIAAGRMIVASAILIPLALRNYRDELTNFTRQDLMLATLSGLVLGVHFATWISSLEYISVVNSVVLVTTNPLWVALLAPIFLGESMHRQTLIGLGLAFGGGILVAFSGETGDPPTRADPLLGNSLAVIGAIAVAIYYIIGRRLRAKFSLIPYITVVYGIAGITLILASIVTGDSANAVHLSAEALFWLLMLGLIPQLVGHSSFNYALGFLPAGYVSLVILAESVFSGILALILLNERPVPLQLVGALFILAGIYVATRDQIEGIEEQRADVSTPLHAEN